MLKVAGREKQLVCCIKYTTTANIISYQCKGAGPKMNMTYSSRRSNFTERYVDIVYTLSFLTYLIFLFNLTARRGQKYRSILKLGPSRKYEPTHKSISLKRRSSSVDLPQTSPKYPSFHLCVAFLSKEEMTLGLSSF